MGNLIGSVASYAMVGGMLGRTFGTVATSMDAVKGAATGTRLALELAGKGVGKPLAKNIFARTGRALWENVKGLWTADGASMIGAGMTINSPEFIRQGLAQGLSWEEARNWGLAYGAVATLIETVISPGFEKSLIHFGDPEGKIAKEMIRYAKAGGQPTDKYLKGLADDAIRNITKNQNPWLQTATRTWWESFEEGTQFMSQKGIETMYDAVHRFDDEGNEVRGFKDTEWFSAEFGKELWENMAAGGIGALLGLPSTLVAARRYNKPYNDQWIEGMIQNGQAGELKEGVIEAIQSGKLPGYSKVEGQPLID